MDEPRRCTPTRRDGSPCAAPPSAIGDDGRCWAHSEAKREARREARAKGGANRATSVRAERLMPARLRPVLGAVLAALHDVRSEAITPAQGSAIASLAGAAVKVFQVGVLEERIERLEALQEGRVTA